MKTIEERRKEFLDDEVAYYGEDPSRRAVVPDMSGSSSCQYKTSDGRKCAIGRYITEDKYTKELEDRALNDVLKVLPLEISELGFNFLLECQGLHDRTSNWNTLDGGLSGLGRERYGSIVRDFLLKK